MYTPTLDKCDDYTHPCHCRLFPTKKKKWLSLLSVSRTVISWPFKMIILFLGCVREWCAFEYRCFQRLGVMGTPPPPAPIQSYR